MSELAERISVALFNTKGLTGVCGTIDEELDKWFTTDRLQAEKAIATKKCTCTKYPTGYLDDRKL